MTDYAQTLDVSDQEDIYLRLIREADVNELYPVLDANREFLQEHQDWARDLTRESFQGIITENLEYIARDQFLQYRIVEKAGDSIVGSVTFYAHDLEASTTNLGFWLIEDAQGKGYAAAASKRFVAYGFEVWSLQYIGLQIEADNARSQHLAEKIGAHKTDIVEHEPWYGRIVTSELWKIERTI